MDQFEDRLAELDERVTGLEGAVENVQDALTELRGLLSASAAFMEAGLRSGPEENTPI